jgi:hypothetical protein
MLTMMLPLLPLLLLGLVATTLVRAQTKPDIPLGLPVCLAELTVVRLRVVVVMFRLLLLLLLLLLLRARVAQSSAVIALGVREVLLRQLVLLVLLPLGERVGRDGGARRGAACRGIRGVRVRRRRRVRAVCRARQ